MPDVSRTEPGDLRVVDLDASVRVALTGLAPVYRFGLSAGLAAAGMTCTALASPAELPAVLVGLGALVVVLPTSHAPALLTTQQGAPEARLSSVHVVGEATTQAYTDALRAGATGVVAADAELSQVVDVVRAAAAGQTLLPRWVARAMCRPQAGPVPQLQPREREWLHRLANSGTVSSLARASGYSEREMYRLLAGVYARLGAGNRTEALLLAERWGLFDDEAR